MTNDESSNSKTVEVQDNDKIDIKWNDSNTNNLRIISADGITFFIPRHYLQTASHVFCEKFLDDPTNSHQPITFTDAQFENSDTLRIIFDILDGTHRPSHPPSFELYQTYDAVLFFAEKWDCIIIRYVVLNHVRDHSMRWTQGGQGYLWTEGFILAARHGEMELCSTLFNISSGTWGDVSAKKLGVVEGTGVMDPKGWPFSMVKRLPTDYLWALSTIMEPYNKASAQPSANKRVILSREFQDLIVKWKNSSE